MIESYSSLRGSHLKLRYLVIIMLTSLTALEVEAQSVWTVTTDVTFPAGVARGWGFSYLPAISPDDWTLVTGFLKEEGSLVDWDNKTCDHTYGTATNCVAFAIDSAPTLGYEYCGEASAVVPPGASTARTAGPDCEAFGGPPSSLVVTFSFGQCHACDCTEWEVNHYAIGGRTYTVEHSANGITGWQVLSTTQNTVSYPHVGTAGRWFRIKASNTSGSIYSPAHFASGICDNCGGGGEEP